VAIATGTKGTVYVDVYHRENKVLEDVQLKRASKNLELKAAELLNKLPQMTPESTFETVKVSFSIPINFQLQ